MCELSEKPELGKLICPECGSNNCEFMCGGGIRVFHCNNCGFHEDDY